MNINNAQQSAAPATNKTSFSRIKQLTERYKISASSIWAGVKAGTFPKPVKLSPNCTAWIDADTEEWAQDRISDSRQ